MGLVAVLAMEVGLEVELDLGLGLGMGLGLVARLELRARPELRLERGWELEWRLDGGRVAAIKGGGGREKRKGGDKREERQRGESNVRLPASQSMLGLWRASHKKSKNSGKWATMTIWKVISSMWLPWTRMLVG